MHPSHLGWLEVWSFRWALAGDFGRNLPYLWLGKCKFQNQAFIFWPCLKNLKAEIPLTLETKVLSAHMLTWREMLWALCNVEPKYLKLVIGYWSEGTTWEEQRTFWGQLDLFRMGVWVWELLLAHTKVQGQTSSSINSQSLDLYVVS